MLLDTVRKTIKEYSMLETGDKVLCAVSGGADSICLLHVLLSLKDEYNLSIYVANVNHLIRGEESDRDSKFVKKFCKEQNVSCFYREYDVPSISKQRKMGEEECGRTLRYEFFDEISKKLGGVKIATAHNINDNAETILFRLVRGSSAQGLCGIRYKRENIIRPLLDVSRNDIEAYLKEHNLNWCEDSTNKLTMYARNRIRLRVVPELEAVASGTCEKIVAAAKKLAEDDLLLSELAENIAEKCVFDDYLIIEPVFNANIALKRRIVASVLEKWQTKEISGEKVENFIRFLSRENGKCFDINSEYYAEKSYDKVFLRKREKKETYAGILDEKTPLEHSNWVLSVSYSSVLIKPGDNNTAIFDADKLKPPFSVTYRSEGDRIAQKGMCGTKKLSDIFTDEKIERSMRDTIPIVKKDNDILFVCGIRQSSLYSVDSNTKNYLLIKYKRQRKKN